MKRRPTRPFVVEVKRSRMSRPATVGLHEGQGEAPVHELPPVAGLPSEAEGLNGGSEHGVTRRTAETPFGRKPVPPHANGRHRSAGSLRAAETSATPQPEPTKKPVTGRILPDLLSVDPLELRLRQEAEEQAARRRGPRGPRKTPGPARRPGPRPDADAARRTAQAAPASRNETSAGPVRAVRPPVATDPKSATRKAVFRGLHSEWALRRACRKAKRTGSAMPLRAGERWKRRLPVSSW
jgi:hypothetical protein